MTTNATADAGQRHRDAMAARSRARTRAAQEIGPLPKVEDPEKRAACDASLRVFCETCFPATFALAWSANHLRVIEKLERSIRQGDLFALAMPRASGKTSLVRAAILWAVLTGARRYVVVVAANESKAIGAIEAIKSFVGMNDLLYAIYAPEIHAFRALGGEVRLCPGQSLNGERTRIRWEQNSLIFATIPGSVCSGSVIAAYGITSSDLLGSSHTLNDGQTVIRPDLIIVDDPQTNESARSPTQTATRHQIISADILGMAGPGVRMAGVTLCTVKQKNDLSSRLLDRKQSPEWRGERMALLDSLPTRMDLWDRYSEIKHECERKDESTEPATQFVRDNFDAMHEGALPTWPARFQPGQVSAVHYAMDLYYQDRASFQSEYQNDPLERESTATMRLTPVELCQRVNNLPRGTAPLEATVLTAFIDVQKSSLWWTACWFDPSFTCGLLDCGVFPEQSGRSQFSLSDVEHGGKTIQSQFPNAGFEGQLTGALTALTTALLGREWPREDGTSMKIDRCLIDANWGSSTDIVKAFCRRSAFGSTVIPSHGRFIGAGARAMNDYTARPGERCGDNWRMPAPSGDIRVRHVAFDANYWKTFLHARMSTAIGDPGAFTLFGKRPADHIMFADHCAAEYSVAVESKGRKVDEWKQRPDHPDNHWFDCAVGCMVAASICGCALPSMTQAKSKSTPQKTRPKVAYL